MKFRVLEKNWQSFIAGCNCHLARLTAGKVGSAYSNAPGFDCEEHHVGLYYFFKGSLRQKGILPEVTDRGNSNKTDASGRKHSTKFKRLKDVYEDHLTEVHLSFYVSALSIFTNYNLFLQRGDSLAQKFIL